jgi:Ca-activated chloride channel family protein
MRFANPEAFLLLLLLPVFAFLRRKYRPDRQAALPLPTYSRLMELPRSGHWKLWLPRFFYLLGVLCLIGALARPQFGREITSSKEKGVDIILALDTSGSMQAQDFQPNRLEAAKKVISEFVANQKSNRIGVVVFAGRSFTLLPLTTDYALVLDAIKDIHKGTVKIDGTAIGDGIANSVYRFKSENAKSRVIVLLTDGENTMGNIQPLVAAQVARQKNIKIYTIGMGKAEGAPVPMINPQTGQLSYMRDRQGNLFLTRINAKELTEMANLTGGLYFQADNAEKLTAIYERIGQMEKSEFETKRTTLYLEQMIWLALPALILLSLSFILRTTLGRVVRV